MEDDLLYLYNQNLANEATDLYDQRQRDLVNQAAMNVFQTGFNNRNDGIMSTEQAQPFQFLSSAYEDQDEDAEQVDYLPGQEPSGIAKLLDYIPFAGEKSLGRFIIDQLPQLSPEAKNIRNFYGSQFGLTPTGQVASGIMKGYNPVSGSDLLNRFTGGLVPAKRIGLSNAIQKRISNILGRKIAQTDVSRARVKKLKELRDREIRDRADFGESLSSIGKSTFTGKGQAFEAQNKGTFTTPSGQKGYYGGR